MEFKKIHDLPVLLQSCSTIDSNLEELQDDCKFLNRFYLDTRYPVHWPANYTKEEAFKAKKAAEHIRDAIRNVLKSLYPSIS